MEEIKKTSTIQKFNSAEELSKEDKALLEQAKNAVNTAYAPYSEFYVGCALLLENGVAITGSNQENIAFPSGSCAERVAVFSAGAQYPDIPIKAMAITAKAKKYQVKEPVMSCGACLQSISEFEMKFNKPIHIILQGELGEIYIAEGTQTFMPFQFWINELKR